MENLKNYLSEETISNAVTLALRIEALNPLLIAWVGLIVGLIILKIAYKFRYTSITYAMVEEALKKSYNKRGSWEDKAVRVATGRASSSFEQAQDKVPDTFPPGKVVQAYNDTAIGGCVAAAVIIAASTYFLLDLWSWVGAFHPEAYGAYKVLFMK